MQAVALDIDDLEVDATPEDLMLSYVSGEKGKVRHCPRQTHPLHQSTIANHSRHCLHSRTTVNMIVPAASACGQMVGRPCNS